MWTAFAIVYTSHIREVLQKNVIFHDDAYYISCIKFYIIVKRLGQHVYLLEGGLAVVLYPAMLAQECGGQPYG